MQTLVCFFFQAEDGIRDKLVTGVQTCALPIFRGLRRHATGCAPRNAALMKLLSRCAGKTRAAPAAGISRARRTSPSMRQIGRASVGKECRSRWPPEHYKKEE